MTIELRVEKNISMDEIAKTLLRDDIYFLPNIGTIIGDAILDKYNTNIDSVDNAIDNLTRDDYIELFKALAEHLEKKRVDK